MRPAVSTSSVSHESEIERRWWAMLPGSVLPLSGGGLVRVVFPGYPGGPVGPDVHDAVLCLPSFFYPVADGELQLGSPGKYVGDIEFHIRASDWEAHQHHTDVRYNNVILHVVLICDRVGPTIRQDGQIVPVCSLQDLPLAGLQVPFPLPLGSECAWACHRVMQCLSAAEHDRLLVQAGLLRFEQKVHAFVEQLHSVTSIDEHDLYDTCLIPALAEGLGYGRDRGSFRAAGLHLLRKTQRLPEPLLQYPQTDRRERENPMLPPMPPNVANSNGTMLNMSSDARGHTLEPSPLDVARLRVLSRIVAQWRTPGIWTKLCGLLLPNGLSSAILLTDVLQSLRDAFRMLGLSLARTDILICNVVLPFAAAVALLEHNTLLYERAQAIYVQHPGLSSNRITRMISTQLLLHEDPRGSCQQQGLHFIYQQTCREKHCEVCLIGKRDI